LNSTFLLLLSAIAEIPAPTPTSATLAPIDQCATVEGFAPFRQRLGDAVARQDSQALLALVADDVRASFGQGGDGKAAFVEAWTLADRDEVSPVWNALESALALGCAQSGDALVSPSIIAQLDPMVDGFTAMLAVSPDAVLRVAPNDGAQVVTALHWDLLTLTDMAVDEGWYPVKLADGRAGFVRAEHVRSVLDYRAVFERRNGRWLMTAFVGGD